MRLASPKPCCGPMVSSVRNTIRSSVPWRMPGSLVDIQEEYDSVPFGCQEEFSGTGAPTGSRRRKAPAPPRAAKIEAGSSMDRPAAANPATARDIILEIVRNMREGLEPLHYSTLPPAIFHVYLHTSDMERLRGILPRTRATWNGCAGSCRGSWTKRAARWMPNWKA